MLAEMKQLAMEKTICVLATVAGNKPYCSLMAYATDENCTEIYMATQRSTQKFRNLAANPAVPPSLLADVFESLVAAIYLDGGIESAKRFIVQYIGPEIELGTIALPIPLMRRRTGVAPHVPDADKARPAPVQEVGMGKIKPLDIDDADQHIFPVPMPGRIAKAPALRPRRLDPVV